MNNLLIQNISLFFFLILIITDGSNSQGGKGKGEKVKGKKAANCNIVLNSPQLAILCRLPNGTNAILPAFQGLTADEVCDSDCRCVMGAQGGGKCGTSPTDKKIYCICDYENPMAAPVPPALVCAVLLPVVTNLCTPRTGITGKFSNKVCNADCQCSHGYPSSKKNTCTTSNGVTGNKVTYCVCNNAKNLS